MFHYSLIKFYIFEYLLSLNITRPKFVGNGYVFSMANGTIGEWFFARGEQMIRGGGGGFFKKKFPARKTLKKNYLARVP